jgi:undecaprenyl-diphosphatase
MLLVTAVLLYITHRYSNGEGSMTKGRSIIVGISQAIAILPGISRSGSTIATSLLLGISKEKAARFSFLMVLPVIFGGMLIEAKDFVEEGAQERLNVMALIVGFVTAFVVGVVACKWMVAIVKKSKLSYFALYCAIVGVIAVAAGMWIA